LSRSGAGRKSLKKYEVTNLLFFIGLILALGILVTFVFRFYGNQGRTASGEAERGIVSEALYPGSDIGMFYLGTNIFETSRQYRNPMEIPVTDDGFLKELFSIPGVKEVTVDQRSIMIRKDTSVSWDSMRTQIRQTVERHLHMHF
jgi:hypothetical protein